MANAFLSTSPHRRHTNECSAGRGRWRRQGVTENGQSRTTPIWWTQRLESRNIPHHSAWIQAHRAHTPGGGTHRTRLKKEHASDRELGSRSNRQRATNGTSELSQRSPKIQKVREAGGKRSKPHTLSHRGATRMHGSDVGAGQPDNEQRRNCRSSAATRSRADLSQSNRPKPHT